MTRIVVAGSINTDLVVRVRRFPDPGETVLGASFDTYGGGKGANQACAAARLGASVMMVGAVGEDAYREERLAGMKDAGVDITSVLTKPEVSGGIAVIQVEESGQNAIVLVPGANGEVSPEDVETSMSQLNGDVDILCAQFELSLETVTAALEAARVHGVRTIVNAAPIIEGSEALLPLIDVLIVNEIEAGQLLGRGPIEVGDAPESAASLATLGPEVVYITLGEHGAYILGPGIERHIDAPRVEVVDTTGAGDACVGAFIASLADGAELEAAARRGVFAGSYAVEHRGAQSSQPTREDLEEFISRHGGRA